MAINNLYTNKYVQLKVYGFRRIYNMDDLYASVRPALTGCAASVITVVTSI